MHSSQLLKSLHSAFISPRIQLNNSFTNLGRTNERVFSETCHVFNTSNSRHPVGIKKRRFAGNLRPAKWLRFSQAGIRNTSPFNPVPLQPRSLSILSSGVPAKRTLHFLSSPLIAFRDYLYPLVDSFAA